MAPNKPFITWKELKEDIKAASIEVIGTTVFLLLALGSIQSAKLSVAATQGAQVAEFGPHSLDHNVYISASAGVSLLASAWMFYRITGGLFNPAVSLALRLIGQITTVRLALYLIAQLTGAIIASALIRGLTPEPFLIMNKLGEKINVVQGLFIELFCTSILILAILMLAAEKSRLTPMAPIGISMTLFACHMFAISFTGASLNPARTFGPAVIGGFGREHWIYWVGPLAGSCLSVGFYAWLKHTKYWRINPGQTSTDHYESPEDPAKRLGSDVEGGRRQNVKKEEGHQHRNSTAEENV